MTSLPERNQLLPQHSVKHSQSIRKRQLIESVFSRFSFEGNEFQLEPQMILSESKKIILYGCRRLCAQSRQFEVVLKVRIQQFDDLRTELQFVKIIKKTIQKLNKCTYIVKHLAVGFANNIFALCTEFIQVSDLRSSLQLQSLTSSDFSRILQGYIKAGQFLNQNELHHNNISLSNLFVTLDKQPLLGSVNILEIVEPEDEKDSFYFLGWAFIELFCYSAMDKMEFEKIKNSFTGVSFKNQVLPPKLQEVLNSMIYLHMIVDIDIRRDKENHVCLRFQDICEHDELTQSFLLKILKSHLQEGNTNNLLQNQEENKEYNTDDKKENQEESNQLITYSTHNPPLRTSNSPCLGSYLSAHNSADTSELIETYDTMIIKDNKKQSSNLNKILQSIIVESHWRDSTPIVLQAAECIQKEDFNRAIFLLKLAKNLNPFSSCIYSLLGLSYQGISDFTHAEKSHLESFRLMPSSCVILNRIGSFYYSQQAYKSSNNYFFKSLKINPQEIETLKQIGVNSFQLMDYKTTEKCALKIINLSPQIPSGYLLLIIVYSSQKQYEKVSQVFALGLINCKQDKFNFASLEQTYNSFHNQQQST